MYAPYVCMNLLPDCVPFQHSSDNNTYYVKIHCPFYVLCDGAELMNLKLPFKVTASRINLLLFSLFIKFLSLFVSP